jgi:CheY-like chemotaxis protein
MDMPDMNGLQLVEHIGREHGELPVILMTAFGSEDIAALALRKGAASYVPKAYLLQDIVPTLNRTLAVTQLDRFHHKALACLTQLEAHFDLENDPNAITPLIGHLEEVLIRLNICGANERMRIAVALQEALLNGMYHGNLEVSSELRQNGDKAYHDLIEQRRHEDPYQRRRVHLAVKVTSSEAVFVVRDDGPGFDPSNLPDPDDPANLERQGGRGLLLIRTFMDNVFHNKNGNEITLIKRRDPGMPSSFCPHTSFAASGD